MSGRSFTMVATALWRSDRFLGTSSDAKALHLYFMTSPHQNSAGCYRVPDGYVCADLGWTAEKYQKARKELVDAELVAFDKHSSEVYLLRWFQHCAPKGAKQQAGTRRIIESIASDTIREKVEEDYDAAENGAPPPQDKVTRLIETEHMKRRSQY
jgi:hypothetical protein